MLAKLLHMCAAWMPAPRDQIPLCIWNPGVTTLDDTDGTHPPNLYYYIREHHEKGFGEIHVVDDRCAPCLADTYCTGTDDLSADCPANTQSPPASNTVTDCVCRVGQAWAAAVELWALALPAPPVWHQVPDWLRCARRSRGDKDP